MARPLRIELAGGVYHVTSRGDGREDIYVDNADRHAWLQLFGSVCDRFNWACHAWCQMGNHYHIVVETIDGNLARGMRHLNGVYTQRMNRRHERVGHVFQGRYKAILVEKESHLLELARYVVLNPLRAGIVHSIDDWPWSSYHSMIGKQQRPDWLHTDWLLARFGSSRSIAAQNYMNFVRAGIGLPPIWENLRGQIYLGSEAFMQTMKAAIAEAPADAEIPRAQRHKPGLPLSSYRGLYLQRADAIAAAYASGSFTMQEIANEFKVHYSTVSRSVYKLRDCKT